MVLDLKLNSCVLEIVCQVFHTVYEKLKKKWVENKRNTGLSQVKLLRDVSAQALVLSSSGWGVWCIPQAVAEALGSRTGLAGHSYQLFWISAGTLTGRKRIGGFFRLSSISIRVISSREGLCTLICCTDVFLTSLGTNWLVELKRVHSYSKLPVAFVLKMPSKGFSFVSS